MIDVGNVTGLAWWQAILAAIVVLLGAARLTRLVTYDDFPPIVAIRMWWDKVTDDGPWAKLLHCSWCFSFWASLLAIGSFFLTPLWVPLAWAWWIFWGALAASYVAALIVYWDEGNPND